MSIEGHKIPGKRCSKCRAVLPFTRFVRDKNRKDGRSPQCSSCTKARIENWRRRPEVVERNRLYQRAYTQTSRRKEQILNYQKTELAPGVTRAKAFKLKYKYGLSVEAYLRMLNDQGNACAICRAPFESHAKTQIDHCHSTGALRGILCAHCNRGLGHANDSIEVLEAMIKYLREGQMRCDA